MKKNLRCVYLTTLVKKHRLNYNMLSVLHNIQLGGVVRNYSSLLSVSISSTVFLW